MAHITLYHNTRCSKSRETLSILESYGEPFDIVDYLAHPPTREELHVILQKLGKKPRDIVRTGEAVFKELNLDLNDDTAVLKALVTHPILIERPIVVRGEKAVLGRPPEQVRVLFDH